MHDQQLHDYLFGPNPDGFGYYVHKYRLPDGTTTIRHYPSASADRIATPPRSGAVIATGYRGLIINHKARHIDEYPVGLAWVGLDIDAEDNLKFNDLPFAVLRVIEDRGAIRLSKSGLGVHVIIRVGGEKMSWLPYAMAKALARDLSNEYVGELDKAGIKTCVHGLPNLWMLSEGGKQHFISQPNTHVSIDSFIERLNGGTSNGLARVSGTPLAADTSIESFEGSARKVIELLIAAKVLRADGLNRKMQVNIGQVKRALAGHFDIVTVSKCRVEHEHEVNGFIQLDPGAGSLALVSNPDNGVILKLM